MNKALHQADVRPDEVAYINAHGTATPANDGAEEAAYRKVFGEGLAQVAISSVKSGVGHTLGAAGVIEAVVTVEAMRQRQPIPALAVADPLPEMAASLANSDG